MVSPHSGWLLPHRDCPIKFGAARRDKANRSLSGRSVYLTRKMGQPEYLGEVDAMVSLGGMRDLGDLQQSETKVGLRSRRVAIFQ